MVKWIRVLVALAILMMLASACKPKAVPEINDAEAAIASAKSAGAEEYAPTKLKAAEEALAAAKKAQQNRNYEEARKQAILAKKLADEAREEAIAAKAKANEGAPVETTPQPTENAPAERGANASDYLKTIYFDFDSYTIGGDSRGSLDNASKFLSDNANVNIAITGNCDWRGTDDYNMALGERRANEVSSYLVNSGVKKARIKTSSSGEEKSDQSCQDDDCWKKDRRADIAAQ